MRTTQKMERAVKAGLELTVAPQLDANTIAQRLKSFSPSDRKEIAVGVSRVLTEALARHTEGGASPQVIDNLLGRLETLQGSLKDLAMSGFFGDGHENAGRAVT